VTVELDSLLSETREGYKRVLGEAATGFYLYGAGFVGKWSVGYLEQCGMTVLGFIDSDQSKWGKTIVEKTVFSPSDPLVINSSAILITSRHAVPAIKKNLAHLSACLMSIDAFVVHHVGREKIKKVESLFSHDRRSLETFRAVLVSMLTGTTQELAPYASNHPFFDRFGFFNRDGEIFVDAGAYVGDSLERFIWSVNGVFRHIHAFEPGGAQFAALKKRVRRLREEWALDPDSISMINKALSSESQVVRVHNASHLTQTSIESIELDSDNSLSSEIQTVSLDTYLDGQKYSFLKVDVEGSEADLLVGARDSIIEHRPRIALSVYHFPTDIFELPLQVQQINKDYIFSIDHHSSKLMETVLYCRDKND